MENLSIIIKALLEKKSKEDIIGEIKQIQNIINQSPLKIKIDVDNAEFKNFAENLKRVNNNINEINNNITKSLSLSTHEYDKLIKIYKGELSEGQTPDVKIKEITDAYGRQIQTIEKLDAETNSYVVTETKVIDNQKKRLAEEKKISTTIENEIKLLQTRIQLLKQNYWTGDFTEIDKFAEKLNVSLIDPANYKTQLADLKNEYQLIANTIQESHRNNFSALEKEIQLENQKNASVMQNWVKQLEIDAEIRKAESDRIKNQMQINAQIESQTLKLQQQLDLFKQKMLGGEGFKGDIDIALEKFGDRINKETLEELRKSIKGLSVDTPDLENKIKKLNIQFSSLRKEASQSASVLVRTLENAYKFMRFYLVGGTLVGFVNALKDALNTLKEIDTQLVNIAKVTSYTKSEMQALTEHAIEISKVYGRTPQEYLQSVVQFAQAGFEKQSEQLAELSMLLQNVGDVSVNTANEMLLAVNAAYKLGGSQEKLIEIVDMLNNVANKNPTTISKMAEAISSAASVFYQSGLSINEFVALVGTATSATQRSGSEVARGLRTVLMNIMGVTDELGETTEETISKAEKVLKKYGIEVRESLTEFRNPMEVLMELAKKYNSTLSDVAKSEITAALAGKYRANILTSVLQNWDMVEKQLQETMSASGSAIQENERYLESWEARSKQLSASVTEFFKNLIDTDTVKGFIGVLTDLMEILDVLVNNPLSQFIIKVGLTSGAIVLLTQGLNKLSKSTLGTQIGVLALDIVTKGFSATLKELTATMLASPLFWVVAGTATIYAIIEAIDLLTVSVEEQEKKVAILTDEYNSLKKEIEELKNVKNPTEDQKEYLKLLERELELQEKILKIERTRLMEKEVFGEGVWGKGLAGEIRKNIDLVDELSNVLQNSQKDLTNIYDTFTEEELIKYSDDDILSDHIFNLREQLQELEKELLEQRRTIKEKYLDVWGEDAPKKLKDLVAEIDEVLPKLQQINGVVEDNVEATKDNVNSTFDLSKAYEDLLKSISNTSDDLKTLNQILDDVQNGQSLNAETVLDLIQKHEELIPAIHKTADGWTIEKDAIENLRKAKIEEARVAIENQINSAEATLDNVYARVEAYGIEIEAIKDLKSAQQEASKLGFKRVFGETAFEDIKFDDLTNKITIGDKITEWSKEEYDKIKQSFNEQKLAHDTILKIGELRERNKKLLELLSDPNLGVSSSKSTPFSEQFDFINTKIKSLNQELKELQQQLDDTFSPADKQTIIDKMIVAQQKKADLLKEAIKTYEDSAQKELQKIPESLRSAVVSGSFNIVTISEEIYGEERAKEISEAIKQYQSLTDTIIGLKNEYAEIDNIIRGLDLDKITLSFKEFDDKIKESDRALEELDYQLNLLKDNDYDKKAEILTKKIEVVTKQVNEYEQELERLKAIVPANEEEAEKLQERIDELTKKIREGKISIKEYNDTLEETAKNLFSTLLNTPKDIDKKIRESDRALEELDYQLNLLGKNDFDRKAEILTKKIEVTTSQVNEYAKELERLKAIVPGNEEEAEKLKERIDELTKKFREGKVSIKEYNDILEETAKSLVSTLLNIQKDIDKKNLENQLKEREKLIYDITEAEFEAYKKAKIESLKKQKEENEKFATEEAKELVRLLTEQIKLEESISYKDIVNFGDLYKEIHNEKIKQYQDTIDMLERSNELEQQRLEREERILEIQELQLKLQNTLNNRNIQILRKKEDGSWEYDYVADPEKVEELQKQIAEKQKDFDEWERNNSLKQVKELLRQKIEQERELIRISEETYNRIAEIETTMFNKHYENMDILAENMLDNLKNTYSNKWDEIINVLKEKVSIAEREYAKLLGASVAGVSVQIPNRNTTTQTPSTGFGTTPTAESEAYIRQLKEAVGGDREAFRQAEIVRTEQVIANRKAQGLDTSAQEAYLESLLKNTFKFEKGGLVDFTGLAWVDGSKTKPEAFLNPTETKLIGKLADSLPNMANILNNFATTKMKLPSLSKISNNKEVKQIFNIGKLEFPNVRTADEIKAAILDLPRLSLQSAKAY